MQDVSRKRAVARGRDRHDQARCPAQHVPLVARPAARADLLLAGSRDVRREGACAVADVAGRSSSRRVREARGRASTLVGSSP